MAISKVDLHVSGGEKVDGTNTDHVGMELHISGRGVY